MLLVGLIAGFAVLGMVYKFVLEGSLRNDWSAQGWAIKIVFVLAAAAMVAFPVVVMFKGKKGSKAALRTATAGVQRGLAGARRSVLSPMATTATMVKKAF